MASTQRHACMSSNLAAERHLSIRNTDMPMFFLSLYVGMMIEYFPARKAVSTAMAFAGHSWRLKINVSRPARFLSSLLDTVYISKGRFREQELDHRAETIRNRWSQHSLIEYWQSQHSTRDGPEHPAGRVPSDSMGEHALPCMHECTATRCSGRLPIPDRALQIQNCEFRVVSSR